MIELIEADEAFMPAVLEIEEAAFFPPWSEGALLNELGREDGFFGLAVDNGTVIGFCILRSAADEAELYQIAVHDQYRRSGTADRLLEAAERWCREKGIRSVYLEVRKSNSAAIALYKKHHFKNQGRRKNYYSSPVEDAVIMALDLGLEL